jgi:cyclopropane fatty-acyl-phospholipid synthase-like methyltransferase
MFSKEYWENRAKSHGHTGHSEPFLYCFDQEARKYAIDKILHENNLGNRKNALDFGCGAGDFLPITSKYAQQILGYDLSENVVEVAKHKYQNEKIMLTASLDEIKNRGPFDLVVIIGVLQTLTVPQLKDTLRLLSANMTTNSAMVCMEFFRTPEVHWQDNEKASKDDWYDTVNENAIKIVKEYSFYNPHMYPSRSWKLYKYNIFMNLLKPFKQYNSVQRLLTSKSERLIAVEDDVLQPQNDIFKIYVLQKQ